MGERRPTLTKYTPSKRQVELCIKFPTVNPLTDRLLRLSLTLFFKYNFAIERSGVRKCRFGLFARE